MVPPGQKFSKPKFCPRATVSLNWSHQGPFCQTLELLLQSSRFFLFCKAEIYLSPTFALEPGGIHRVGVHFARSVIFNTRRYICGIGVCVSLFYRTWLHFRTIAKTSSFCFVHLRFEPISDFDLKRCLVDKHDAGLQPNLAA